MAPPEVYHLALSEKTIAGAQYALLPGDPFRSALIAGAIAKCHGGMVPDRPLAHRREYCTYLMDICGAKVLIASTGIGGPSTSIAVDELAQLGVHTFIRVGTTGAIQDSIEIGDVVITNGSVRLDGASRQYAPIEYPAVAHHEVLTALVDSANAVMPSLKHRFHVGITASTDTFYQGQERRESFLHYVPRAFQGLTEELRQLHVLNYEMESATLLTLCNAFGLRGGCVTGVIGNRTTAERITEHALRRGEEHAIQVAIKAMELLIQNRRA